MAQQSINELHRGRRVSKDSSPNTRLTRVFRVVMEQGDSPWDTLESAGVPARGDAHPDVSSALCQEVACEQEDGGDFEWVFIVTATYATLTPGGTPTEDSDQDPTSVPIVIEWGEELITGPMEFGYGFYDGEDRQDKFPVVNSAWDKFDPPPLRDVTYRVLTVTKNQSAFNVSAIDAYKNHVNDRPFYGFDEELVLFTSATAQSQYTGTTFYWQVRYQFKIRPDQWITSLLDNGVYGYNASNEKVRLQDDSGNDVVEPIPLDGNGQKLALDRTAPDGNDFVYMDWYTYPSKDLNGLGVFD